MQISPDILEGKKKIHFIGIGGSGMFPLAQILQARGFEISGSDNNPGDTLEAERALGMRVIDGQAAKNVEGAELIVYSAAIMEENPELVAARKGTAPVIERSELFGLITHQYDPCVAVCGTHGKTTTTAMLTHILLACGKDPSAVIGGRLPEIGGNGRVGKTGLLVCEACEYADTFLHLYPDIAVLLNVDADHLEYFGSIENIIRSFATFAKMASCVIYAGDDANTLCAVADVQKPKISFGLSQGCDYQAVHVRRSAQGVGYCYDLLSGGKESIPVQTAIPGAHQVLNSLAAIAAAVQVGAQIEEAAAQVSTFSGIHRRFEILGVKNGITIADDYAHHPREIEATLKAAQELHYQRVWAVHQPFTYSRTALLLEDFAAVLRLADRVVLSPIMGAREHNTYGIHAQDLAQRIPGSVYLEDFTQIAQYVTEHAREGDLILTLGCGDVYKCAQKMLNI